MEKENIFECLGLTMKDDIRIKILNYLQVEDSNGCYTDYQRGIEGLPKATFEDALILYIYNEYIDIFDENIFDKKLHLVLDELIDRDLFTDLIKRINNL